MIKDIVRITSIGGLFACIFGLTAFGMLLFNNRGGDMFVFLETTQALPNPISEINLFISVYKRLSKSIESLDFGLPTMEDANFWEKIALALQVIFTGIVKILLFLVVGVIAFITIPILFLVWVINVLIVFFNLLAGTTPLVINLQGLTDLIDRILPQM